jgi:hypothetical protein
MAPDSSVATLTVELMNPTPKVDRRSIAQRGKARLARREEMTAIQVANRSGDAHEGTGAVAGVAMAIALVGGILIGALGAPRTASGPAPQVTGAATTAAAGASLAQYRLVAASLAAAEARHDNRARALYASQLRQLLTAETVASIHAERTRLLSNVAAAAARHDARSATTFRGELAALCGSATVEPVLDFCN